MISKTRRSKCTEALTWRGWGKGRGMSICLAVGVPGKKKQEEEGEEEGLESLESQARWQHHVDLPLTCGMVAQVFKVFPMVVLSGDLDRI